MSITIEPQTKQFDTQSDTCCHVCVTIKEAVLLSCANFYCDNKVHAACAIRPEGTRLHFCSPACVEQYWNR